MFFGEGEGRSMVVGRSGGGIIELSAVGSGLVRSTRGTKLPGRELEVGRCRSSGTTGCFGIDLRIDDRPGRQESQTGAWSMMGVPC